MAKKQKVVLAQLLDVGQGDRYRVQKLVNRVKPGIGAELTQREVKSLIGERNTTVDIVVPKT